jgi:ribose/xylose/arabinose/galactoside ABC-type transport system permease subunit
MLTSWSIKGLIALGVGMVIISRGIDLSSGSVVALASVVAASFAQNPEVSKFGTPPVFVAVVLASLLGILIGVCNGAFVAYTKIPPHRNFGRDDRGPWASAYVHQGLPREPAPGGTS